MAVDVRFEVKPNVVKTASRADLRREMLRLGRIVETGAKRRCPVDTGRLRSSITTTIVEENGLPIARVGTNVNYAQYVHEGTGVYGPRGAPITPKRARFLVFTVRGVRGLVFARSVRGTRRVPFLTDAIQDARTR